MPDNSLSNMMLQPATNSNLSIIIVLSAIYTCRVIITFVKSALQNHLILTNKPNFQKVKFYVNKEMAKGYETKDTWWSGKKQSQTNPNKAKFKKGKMNVNEVLTKYYENKSPIRAPKKQSQISKRQKPMQTSLSKGIMKKTALSGYGKTNPKQTQFKPNQTQFYPPQRQNKPNSNPNKPNFEGKINEELVNILNVLFGTHEKLYSSKPTDFPGSTNANSGLTGLCLLIMVLAERINFGFLGLKVVKRKVDFDVVVVGGGIIGLASAYKIARNHPKISIAVLEKEDRLATHQTGHNSGVIHSGLYYRPGSNKAKNCAKGRKELVAFAREHNIPYEICGKIIVATKEKELANLEQVFQNGLENEIEDIEKIGPEEINEIEPFCRGIAGIRVPCTGIIDFTEVARKLAGLIEAKGKNKVLNSHAVVLCDKHDYFTNVVTNNGTLSARYIVNCAGLQCDRVAKMCGVGAKMRIVPFRGDYYELTKQAKEKVKSLIYPVPDPKLPFLGVHFTRRIDGSVECGPNAVFSFKREGYGKTDFSLRDSWEALSFWGTWKLFRRHWKYGLGEYARAFSKKLFLRQLQRLIPSLQADDIKPGNSGVRAQAVDFNGEPIDDFRIERREGSIHVLNAPSPAATASLAIGDHINQIATEHFGLKD